VPCLPPPTARADGAVLFTVFSSFINMRRVSASGCLATALLVVALAAMSAAQLTITMYRTSSTCAGTNKQVVERKLPYCMPESGASITKCEDTVRLRPSARCRVHGSTV
jgi:hypothetical protein